MNLQLIDLQLSVSSLWLCIQQLLKSVWVQSELTLKKYEKSVELAPHAVMIR